MHSIGVTTAYNHLYAPSRMVEAREPPSFDVANRSLYGYR